MKLGFGEAVSESETASDLSGRVEAYSFIRAKSEKGVALIELAIVLPLFLLIVVGVYEVGRALNQYLVLTQIAYEGVRAGSQLTQIAPACFGTYVYGASNQIQSPSTAQLAHPTVLNRVGFMVELQSNLNGLSLKCDPSLNPGCDAANSRIKNIPTVTSEFVATAGVSADEGCSASYNNSFSVRLSGRYEPLLLPSAFSVPLSVEARSVLLLANEGLNAGGEGIISIGDPIGGPPGGTSGTNGAGT